VSERMRVPCPAARITTAKRRCSLIARSNGMALLPAPYPQTKKAAPEGTASIAWKPRLP